MPPCVTAYQQLATSYQQLSVVPIRCLMTQQQYSSSFVCKAILHFRDTRLFFQ
jgi:hypothetical protein